MKRILILLFVLNISQFANAQSKAFANFYTKYKDKGCFNFDLSTGFFQCMVNDDGKDEFSALLKGIDQIKLFRVPKDQLYIASKDISQLKREIRKESFEDLMSARDKDGDFSIMIKESKGNVKEFVMLANSSDGLLVMNVIGNMPKKKIKEISDGIHIKLDE